MVQPGGRGLHLTQSGVPSTVSPSPPSITVMKTEDFEDVISYLRDYIAICKDKKKKTVLLENTKDTNELENT